MKYYLKVSSCLAIMLAMSFCTVRVAAQAKDYLNETAEDKEKRMSWWNEAKFGMFIHWGPYAVPAGC